MKTLDEVIAWAEAKNCAPRREGRSCDHEACVRNDEAIAFLRSGVEFNGTSTDGTKASGWLIPKQ